jgi:hypothetical protein
VCRIQPLAGRWLVDSHSIHTNPHHHRPRQHPMSARLSPLSLASAGRGKPRPRYITRAASLLLCISSQWEKFSLARAAVAAPPFLACPSPSQKNCNRVFGPCARCTSLAPRMQRRH